jgi:hypothetical protein
VDRSLTRRCVGSRCHVERIDKDSLRSAAGRKTAGNVAQPRRKLNSGTGTVGKQASVVTT